MGSIIDSILCYGKTRDILYIHGVDKNKNVIKRLEKKYENQWTVKLFHQDFLKFSVTSQQKYDYVIGNPPYVHAKHMTHKEIKVAIKILEENGISSSHLKNIWVPFIVASTNMISERGTLAFILPAEILQVKYSIVIQEYLKKHYDRIEITAFDRLFFKEAKQEIILLKAIKQSNQKGAYYTLSNDGILSKNENKLNVFKEINSEIKIKWRNNFLTNDELNIVDSCRNKYKKINEYSISAPGIVTAANDYFILSYKNVIKYGLKELAQPILRRGSLVNGSLVFNQERMLILTEDDEKCCFINFDLISEENMNDQQRKYLEMGEKLNIHRRFKCRNRMPWYRVPTKTISEAFFFKRAHLHPKFILNEARVLATDSAYKVNALPGISIESLIFSFYNTITLLFAEIDGRSYADGVLELTPTEFKNLPIPYINISDEEFKNFCRIYETRPAYEDIIDYIDLRVFGGDRETFSEIKNLRNIYIKMINRRMKKDAVFTT